MSQNGWTPELVTAIATAALAGGTVVLAAVAIWQDTVRGWFYHATLQASIATRPPDCIAVPLTIPDGSVLANGFYFRLWVQNIGNATARNVEVYATELLRRHADASWRRISEFPPMNLKWANVHLLYFPMIVKGMGKHCDVGHIVDPARRGDPRIREENPRLGLNQQQPSLAFDLIAAPNHKGHIIGPGEYQLKIIIAAENARSIRKTLSISLHGVWDEDEEMMFRVGAGMTIT
jgi:hypothetical protein